MPRNGSGVYSLPSNTEAVPNDVISSAKYNQAMNDLSADNNAERPISAGGTGAGTAAAALSNLGGMSKSANLSDVADAATARSNLGVGENFLNAGVVEDVDANNMTEAGVYDLRITAANLPVSSFFSALVSKSGDDGDMIAQFLMKRNGEAAYLRTSQAGVWNDDRQFIMDNDKASQAEAAAGAEDGKWVSPLGVRSAIDALSIGHNQTWQDVSSSRTAGTAYQNTEGRPIMVAMEGRTSSARSVEVSADGAAWMRIATTPDSGVGYAVQNAIAFIVPDGWYYRFSASLTVSSWLELR